VGLHRPVNRPGRRGVKPLIFTVRKTSKDASEQHPQQQRADYNSLAIRRRLGLKEGDRVEFVVEGERTIIRPAQSPKNPFEKYAGALPAFRSEREIKTWVSSLRDEEAVDK
jgi:bifunctional DNA-binding transcriptional regulator/antitoxin component of YhaV-PrlF toxin-antitoxin module